MQGSAAGRVIPRLGWDGRILGGLVISSQPYQFDLLFVYIHIDVCYFAIVRLIFKLAR